jgi:hypothetical protein
MRLLYTSSDGTLKWTKDYVRDEDIPPYAILSHTWHEGQEVTFDDMKQLVNLDDAHPGEKEGYTKIRFCAQQARHDGLEYIWVDTCCIDKSNNTELSEAINSMYRWYQKAAKCYVYLSDVNKSHIDDDGKPGFRASRWFTRGWTLQELLAPRLVEFYSKEGVHLGDKGSLQQTIHDITGIPVSALSQSRLSGFSVAERFSWAMNRQTTRAEDLAYCLLGVFDIHLPLIYGEGQENALRRLKREIRESSKETLALELRPKRDRIPKAVLGELCDWLSAPDPSTNYHRARKQRQPGTGLWLLEDRSFTRWKVTSASRLWLHGIPGCGKTILSSAVIEHVFQYCSDNPATAIAYFYFDFNDAQKQDPELMLRSLLCQLLERVTTTSESIETLASLCRNKQQQPSQQALMTLMEHVIQEFAQVYIVIDALDECTQRSELMDLLKILLKSQPPNLHLLVTSRKERDIELLLQPWLREEDAMYLQSDVVDKDIQQYIRQRLSMDKSLIKWEKDTKIREEIEAALTHGAHGMYASPNIDQRPD